MKRPVSAMAAPLRTRLLFNLELWVRARLMPFQVSRHSLQKALDLATPSGLTSYPGLPVSFIVHRVTRTARRPWLMRDRRCLRQGLLGFRFLREAGHDPVLYFGVAPNSICEEKLTAHCWIVINGKTVLGMPEMPLLTIYAYPELRDPCH